MAYRKNESDKQIENVERADEDSTINIYMDGKTLHSKAVGTDEDERKAGTVSPWDTKGHIFFSDKIGRKG
jgi:hypothetical protein